MLEAALLVGIAAQAVVWHLVARRRSPFWPATTTTFAILGVAALLVGDVACCRETSTVFALALGAVAGAVFYLATRAVVGVASRAESLREAVAQAYRRSDEVSFSAALILSLVVAVPGEELFWRGLVQPELRASIAPVLGAVFAWLAYVGANAAAASLPLLAAAIVGGALWTALGVWTAGVVAPMASHLVWTGLMLVWPPSAARDKVTG